MKHLDWRKALVFYMAHVGETEGVYFADRYLPPGIPQEEWTRIKAEADKTDPYPK